MSDFPWLLVILAYLPAPECIDEDEVLRRYGALKGQAALAEKRRELSEWRRTGDEKRVAEWLEAQRRRMYDIGSFMKIVKQWFTEEYNRRNAHTGTLWESALLEELLDAEKLRRAEEIARKRASGYVMPTDHLTTEAMIAQQTAHLAEVQQAAMELQEARSRTNRRMDRREVTEKGICALLEASA